MRKWKNFNFIWILLLTLLIPCKKVMAVSEVNLSISQSAPVTKIGETVTSTVSLADYSSKTAEIRGLQIDICEIDRNILEVVEYKSLIQSTSAVSNTVSYANEKNRLRLLYVETEKTLPYSTKEMFQVVWKVKADVSGNGNVSLPVKMKVQTTAGNYIAESKIMIQYSESGESVINVDITWGKLEYIYSRGKWNPTTHHYDGAGWSDNNTGYIIIRNNGEDAVQADYSYQQIMQEIVGTFLNEQKESIETMLIEGKNQKKTNLLLSGKPAKKLDQETIGQVTVKIKRR